MIERLVMFPKLKDKSKELAALLFVLVDEVGSSITGFSLSETSKDSQGGLKVSRHIILLG